MCEVRANCGNPPAHAEWPSVFTLPAMLGSTQSLAWVWGRTLCVTAVRVLVSLTYDLSACVLVLTLFMCLHALC